MKTLLNKSIIIRAVCMVCCALTALLPACATSSDSKPADPATGITSVVSLPSFSPVTFSHPIAPVGDIIRLLGEQFEGGIVLMSGLEERAAPGVDFRHTPYQEAVTQLADSINCDYIYTPYYYMILPSEYALLQELKTGDLLDPRYQTLTATVTFGAKTELYNVFSALGASLDITLVADNYIAEARCGEISLSETPFPVILEAIMQSARLAPGTFAIESTPEYIFIHSVQNTALENRLLNASSITAEQTAFLNRSVSLFLPHKDAVSKAPFAALPIPLHEALQPLTEQLGIEIVALRRFADIPINPCTMNTVRVETALNLLLCQWPMPDFGFEVQENRILIRER